MLPDGAVNPASWTAVGGNGGSGDPTAITTAFAVCAEPQGVLSKITRVDAAGPRSGNSFAVITASSAGTRLLGGGVNFDNPAGPLEGGEHLRGAIPAIPRVTLSPTVPRPCRVERYRQHGKRILAEPHRPRLRHLRRQQSRLTFRRGARAYSRSWPRAQSGR